MNKKSMLEEGKLLVDEFCRLNEISIPLVEEHPKSKWMFGVCAYYRPKTVHICVDKCAYIGSEGRAYSYPGYVTDRTPYGVLAHELGHHSDMCKSSKRKSYFGDYSLSIQTQSKEEAITSYCPNFAEWFAEMFRLFLTNPDLLRIIRPKHMIF